MCEICTACIGWSENNLWELVCPFHHFCPGDGSWGFRLGSKPRYLTEPSCWSYPCLAFSHWFFVQYDLLCSWYYVSFKKKSPLSVLFSLRISDSFLKFLPPLSSFYCRILNCFSVFSWSPLCFLKTAAGEWGGGLSMLLVTLSVLGVLFCQ